MLKTAITAAIFAAAGTAFAFDFGEMKTRDLLGLEGPTQARDVSNSALGLAPLALEGIESLKGRALRMRYWTIGGDGGIVPIHDHTNRPAFLLILSGTVEEHSSATDTPIQHGLESLSLEEGALAHWWHNPGSEEVELIAFDVFQRTRALETVETAPVPAPQPLPLPDASNAALDLLGIVDMGAHFDGAFGDGWSLSAYKAVLDPGGVLPDFTAAGEPLQVFVWQGRVTEHGGAAPKPLEAGAGSTLAEGATGWWENTGDTPATLYFGVVEPVSEVEGVPRTGHLSHGAH